MLTFIRIILKITLPMGVLGGFILGGKQLLDTAPEQVLRASKITPPQVEIISLTPQAYQVILKTSGRVQAAISSLVAAEVKGRVSAVAEQFFIGGRVKKGALLLKINDNDYQQSLIIVQAQLAQAQLAIEQGDTERAQVLRDRVLLGLSDKPSQLALHERKRNQAELAAAEARVAQARTQLARTQITAPFDGQITDIKVNIGQFVNTGTVVVALVGTQKLQVRLPLNDRQLAFIQRGELSEKPLLVRLKTQQNTAEQQTWLAELTRHEGVVDAQSLQQMGVAEITLPSNSAAQPPALGLFVSAEIDAAVLQNVLVIPRSSVRNNNEIQSIDGENTLVNRRLKVLWADAKNIVIASTDDQPLRLVKHPITLAADGIEVVVNDAAN